MNEVPMYNNIKHVPKNYLYTRINGILLEERDRSLCFQIGCGKVFLPKSALVAISQGMFSTIYYVKSWVLRETKIGAR